jgi:protein-tyrosine-phosphatase
MSEDRIPFVCLHGAAKSVIAAALFNRRAHEAGLAARAVALGLEPDPAVAPGAAAGLLAEGVDVRGHQPRRATGADLAGARRVVAFGCELGELAPAGVPVEQWADVPAVSEGYAAARARIGARVDALVAELAGAGAAGAARRP